MTTSTTVWNYIASRRWRLSVLLIGLGIVGFLLMGFILKLPLVLTLILALFFGMWGVAAALIEFMVKAVVKSRAPFTFRPREPYEFVKGKKGFLNVALVTFIDDSDPNTVTVFQTDQLQLTYSGPEAVSLLAFMNEIATPLDAIGAPTTETADAGQGQNWPEEE